MVYFANRPMYGNKNIHIITDNKYMHLLYNAYITNYRPRFETMVSSTYKEIIHTKQYSVSRIYDWYCDHILNIDNVEPVYYPLLFTLTSGSIIVNTDGSWIPMFDPTTILQRNKSQLLLINNSTYNPIIMIKDTVFTDTVFCDNEVVKHYLTTKYNQYFNKVVSIECP